LILIGIVGLIVSIGFVFLSAPDLAMTQITVEVVTIILLLLALNFLPKQTPVESSVLRRVRDIAVAATGGLAATVLTYHYLLRDFVAPSISDFHLANSYKGGGGTNVVNVILVDFRGSCAIVKQGSRQTAIRHAAPDDDGCVDACHDAGDLDGRVLYFLTWSQ